MTADRDGAGPAGPQVENKPLIERDPAAEALHELGREAGGPMPSDRLSPAREREIAEKTGRARRVMPTE